MGLIELADLLALNEEEASALLGHGPGHILEESLLVQRSAALTQTLPRLRVIVSAGRRGAYGFEGGHSQYCPAPVVQPVSTAGAGDALLAGVLMFGPSILVTPVLQGDASHRTLYLPDSPAWYDFWTGEAHKGDREIEADATHRIRNIGREPTEMAPWALSVMAGGGKAVLPLPPRAPMSSDRLLPEGVLVLWSYRDLADPRWKIGTKYMQLQQTSNCAGPFKEQMGGIFNSSGWGSYFRRGHLFIKKAEVEKNAPYPDFGCNFELYTDMHSLEFETLGPLRKLNPGETAEHIERWWLFKDIESGDSESWIDSIILPAVDRAG